MSKVKAPKSKGIPSKHLHARTTFLYQAATYLTLQTAPGSETTLLTRKDPQESTAQGHHSGRNGFPLALHLGSDLQQVSRKAQLRLSADLKRTLCKSCNTVLISGRTATQTIENDSKRGKKPWADMLIIECNFCGGKKRFPVGAQKQPKKAMRNGLADKETPCDPMDDVQPSNVAIQTATEADSSTG